MAEHPVTEDELRAHIHALWSTVAPAWAERADYVDDRGAAVTQWMLAATDPRPGDHVLELACGAGGTGMAAAPLVAPAGRVVLSDVAAGMVEAAARRVAERGLDGVATRVLDLDDIGEPDAAFDVVLCRDGLQFAMEPGRAVREIARVLRPGGRVGLALWAAREHNPWLGLVLDAASEQLGRPMPPPGVPGPFSLSDADRVRTLLRDAGFDQVVIEELPVPLRPPTVDAWWAATTSLAGPLAAIIASLPEAASAELQARAREKVAPYVTEDGLELPGLALLASGRKP